MSSLSGWARSRVGEPLKGHDRVESGDLDADHARQVENRVQRRVVVRDAARRLVEPERDDGKLPAQPGVVAHRVGAGGKGEQGVRATAPGFDGHADVTRSRDHDPVRQSIPPGFEHHRALLGREMGTTSGVGPHGHAGHGLRRHPARVRPLGRLVDRGSAEWDGHGRHEAPPQPVHERRHQRLTTRSHGDAREPGHRPRRARAFPLSMAARLAAESSSRSSFAPAFSGSRSGWPVPSTKRSAPIVPSSVWR